MKMGNRRYEKFEDFIIAEYDFRRAYLSKLNKDYSGYEWLMKNAPELQKHNPST